MNAYRTKILFLFFVTLVAVSATQPSHALTTGSWDATIADVNGDGLADRVLHNPITGNWGCWLTSPGNFGVGTKCGWDAQDWGPNYIPMLGDINGDGLADRIVYDTNTGDWGCWLTSPGNYGAGAKCGWDAQDWGGGSYVPMLGDINGDGLADRIVYDTNTGDWGCWLTSPGNYGAGAKCGWDAHQWGGGSYVPMLGDVNGDGLDDRIVYDTNTGDWGCWLTSANDLGAGAKCGWDAQPWGGSGYNAMIGDVNGDGLADRVVHNPTSGDWGCWLTSPGVFGAGAKCGWDAQPWGAANYVGYVGDVNGDGRADRIVYDTVTGDWGCWLTDRNTLTAGAKCGWDTQNWGGAIN